MVWRVSGLGVNMTVLNESAAAPDEWVADAPAGSAGAPTTIYVCTSCRNEANSDDHPRPGLLFAGKVGEAAAADDLVVEEVECLANCKRRLSAALVKPGGWTYVFGELNLDNADDLVEGARLYRDTDNGLIPWRGRPECLKRGLVARIPPTPVKGNSK